MLPAAYQVFERMREGYRRGKFGYLEVLDAQKSLFEAKMEYIDTQATYHSSMADMERSIGQGLETTLFYSGNMEDSANEQ